MLRISETVMSRALNPGSSAGEPDPTRVFGNRQEQFSQLPSAPTGLGGVANPMAGVEGEALARSAQQVGAMVEDQRQYYDNLQMAEEDSKSKITFLEIEKADAELRERLSTDPEHSKKTTTERQQEYELARDAMVDERIQAGGFTHKRVVKNVQDSITNYRYKSSEDYKERVIKPQVVFESKTRDQESDNIVIDTVSISPTPENIAKAQQNILDRYGSPVAFATYGAAGAAQLRAAAQGKLQQTLLQAYSETLAESGLAKLEGVVGPIDADDKQNGVVEFLVADEVGRLTAMVNQLNIPESEKAVLIQKGERGIRQFANNSVIDHNNRVKEVEKQRTERVKDNIDTWLTGTDAIARSDGMTHKNLQQSYEKLAAHPDIANDPQAQRKLYVAKLQVEASMKSVQREKEQIATQRAVKQTLTEMRLENGIAVSGASLDTAWQKNGTLKSFVDGGSVLSPVFVQDIEKAGSVPTSVIGSIQSDLQSKNPEERNRGIRNLTTLKNSSSRSQAALYKSLPSDWAGVLNKLENGQTVDQALSFLTASKPTPDIQKKLETDAERKENREVGDRAMKEAGFDPKKMAAGTYDRLRSEWTEAVVRANGDLKLAADLVKQSLSKNKNIGKSDFSDKIELHPTTNYAPKVVVQRIIEQDFPELKGKKYLPVYGGMITKDGKEAPTYDIYVEDESGVMKPVTNAKKQFYMTPEVVAENYKQVKKEQEDKLLKELGPKAEELRANMNRIKSENKDRSKAVSVLDEIRTKTKR